MRLANLAAIVAVFAVGVFIGAMSIKLPEYARGGQHAEQGKGLIKVLQNYKLKHGNYPDQEWFDNLGDKRVTTEKRFWVYYYPPKEVDKGKYLLISVPIDYGNRYFYGYSDGSVTSSKLEEQNNLSEQVAASDR